MNNLIYILADDPRWDEIVRSFRYYDIYYLRSYVKAFQIHGDGDPILIYYENGKVKAMNVVMKRDISSFPVFRGVIDAGRFYDTVTPYGYGGFLFEGPLTAAIKYDFKSQYLQFCQKNRIIADFTRFHPVISNAEEMRDIVQVTDLGHTIGINLESKELIWSNITSKNRNMIRKAQKAGIEIKHDQKKELFDEFLKIYNATMDRDEADPYYYFGKAFYNSIYEDLRSNYEMFYALLGDKIVSMAIILFCNGQMHYHLAGSIKEFNSLAPSNLLLYEAACWGCDQGFQIFHLGGGVGSDEQGGLFRFKQAFNRNSDFVFSIGRTIFDEDFYRKLVSLRIEKDPTFDINTRFFPKYRG